MSEKRDNYIEEDEIDLRELLRTILDGKYIIAIVTFVVVSLTFIYALKLPNVYQSQTVLIPTEDKSSGGLGGLGGLAAMAGISVGGGGSMTPDVAFNSLLNNYDFMKNFVIDNKVVDYYSSQEYDKNFVFALGFRGVYDLFNPKSENIEKVYDESDIYAVVNRVKSSFSIASDKKTALITVSYSDSDRSYPPVIINAFLNDASKYLVDNNLKNVDSRLRYFEEELLRVDGFELRKSLSGIISSILEEKIMMKSKQYYQCDVLTLPTESYIKAKTKPKRALILVVSFVTSIILGIFLVFFLQFIKKSDDEKIETK